jgi:hypothetical protein
MSNLKIITGHSGSGKTEFCINYVMKEKQQFDSVMIADLDIVNPYFRSREKAAFFDRNGIKLIGASAGLHGLSVDIPALPPEIFGIIDDKDSFRVFDVGGDGIGAKVLSRYAALIKAVPYDMYLVLNANRPETAETAGALAHFDDVQAQSRLKINGLINNTHMLRETAREDVMRGLALCREVSAARNVPLVYNVVPKHLSALRNEIDNVFILNQYYMRPNWL